MTKPELPNRFFPDGEEPNGERVHSYCELSYIDDIVGALLPDERERLKNSQFEKLLEIPESAAFSGKLIHFLLTRQLVVKKKHEIWFIFGGSPIFDQIPWDVDDLILDGSVPILCFFVTCFDYSVTMIRRYAASFWV